VLLISFSSLTPTCYDALLRSRPLLSRLPSEDRSPSQWHSTFFERPLDPRGALVLLTRPLNTPPMVACLSTQGRWTLLVVSLAFFQDRWTPLSRPLDPLEAVGRCCTLRGRWTLSRPLDPFEAAGPSGGRWTVSRPLDRSQGHWNILKCCCPPQAVGPPSPTDWAPSKRGFTRSTGPGSLLASTTTTLCLHLPSLRRRYSGHM
jgi:hypothetical protein